MVVGVKQGWTSDSKIRKGRLAEVRFVLKIGKGRENRRGNREGVRANHAEISGKSIEERGKSMEGRGKRRNQSPGAGMGLACTKRTEKAPATTSQSALSKVGQCGRKWAWAVSGNKSGFYSKYEEKSLDDLRTMKCDDHIYKLLVPRNSEDTVSYCLSTTTAKPEADEWSDSCIPGNDNEFTSLESGTKIGGKSDTQKTCLASLEKQEMTNL